MWAICESWEIIGINWIGLQILSGFNSVCGRFCWWWPIGETFNGRKVFSKWTRLGIQGLWRLRCGAFFVVETRYSAFFVRVFVKSVIANESCVGSGFVRTARQHGMKMLIHLTEQLFALWRWIAFGDGERRDLVVADRENRRPRFPCIQVMDADSDAQALRSGQ